MKRYWVFCYDRYYPSGGFNDFCKDFDTMEDCHLYYEKQKQDYIEVFDSKNNVIVYTNDKDEYDKSNIHQVNPEFSNNDGHLKHLYPKKLWD